MKLLGTNFFLDFLIHIIGKYWEQTSLSVPIPNQRALVHFSRRPSTSGAAARDCGPEVRYHVIVSTRSTSSLLAREPRGATDFLRNPGQGSENKWLRCHGQFRLHLRLSIHLY